MLIYGLRNQMSDVYAAILFFELIDARIPVFESLFALSALTLLLMALPGFALHLTLLRKLRLAHAPTWEMLGKPSVIYYGSLKNGLAMMRFLRHEEYERLGDPSLSSVCRVYRVYTSIYSGMFAAMIVAFCVALATAR